MSHKNLNWICKSGHVWNAPVNSRSQGRGCPIHSGKRVLAGYNDLATINPDLAAQANGWDPTTVTAMSDAMRDWICEEGHEWRATVGDRSRGRGCPIHAGRQVLAGYNDLATINPDLAAQANGWDPSTVTAMSRKKLNWICESGHTWSAPVYSRSAGNGCPYHSGRFAIAGETDLNTTNPKLAKQANGWDPTTVTAGCHKKFNWICESGHTWNATVNSRSKGNGCPIHAGRQVLVGYNDLAFINPELAAQAHGWDPTTVTAMSDKKRAWICEKKHTWSATVHSRSQGNGCPIHAGRKVLVGETDLATTHPEIAAQAHGWDPTTVTAGSRKKRKWRCEFGDVWSATVDNRSKGRNCPSCSPTGFDPNLPGYLYFIEDLKEDLLQIGISNYPEQRLVTHESHGWTWINVQGPWRIGGETYQLEQRILKYLRDHGAIIAKDAGIEKFDGYKESWLRESFPVRSLSELWSLVDDEDWDLEESA